MTLLLSKIFTQLTYPLTLAILLSLVAGLLFWRHRRALGSLCLTTAIAVLWIPATPLCADYLRASLERRYPPVPLAQTPSAAAIVVLGGAIGVASPPRLEADLSAAADRVLHAARLYRAGKAPLIVISGGRLPWSSGDQAEAEAIAELLLEWGVSENAMLLEIESRTTYENAVFSNRLLEANGIEEILLVTSALHMPRALATFRSLGITAIPAPTDFEVVEQRTPTVLHWLPDAAALEGSTRALKEYLGLWVYRWRGWAT